MKKSLKKSKFNFEDVKADNPINSNEKVKVLPKTNIFRMTE